MTKKSKKLSTKMVIFPKNPYFWPCPGARQMPHFETFWPKITVFDFAKNQHPYGVEFFDLAIFK